MNNIVEFDRKTKVILCGYATTAASYKDFFDKFEIVAYAYSNMNNANNFSCLLKKNIPIINIKEINQFQYDYIIICASPLSSNDIYIYSTFEVGLPSVKIRLFLNNVLYSYEEFKNYIYYLKFKFIDGKIKQFEKKLSMVDSIYRMDNIKFYVPNYPLDLLQAHIVDTGTFHEQDILNDVDNYIENNSVIFDIGANIGNHSLYWTKKSSKSNNKVYAFEPITDTFIVLKKNIEINNVSTIFPFNFGFSNVNSKAKITRYVNDNIGGSSVTNDLSGDFLLCTLDSFVQDYNIARIDLLKIDVEGSELSVFEGAKKVLSDLKPNIIVESVEPIEIVKKLLKSYGYRLEKKYPFDNYLFINSKK